MRPRIQQKFAGVSHSGTILGTPVKVFGEVGWEKDKPLSGFGFPNLGTEATEKCVSGCFIPGRRAGPFCEETEGHCPWRQRPCHGNDDRLLSYYSIQTSSRLSRQPWHLCGP